jgi:hypothetical protein
MQSIGGIIRIVGIENVKIGRFTAAVSGSQSITGVGFKPKILIFFASSWSSTYPISSYGFDDGTDHYCLYFTGVEVTGADDEERSIHLLRDDSNSILGYVSSMDNDGFTVNWTVVGDISAEVVYLAMK